MKSILTILSFVISLLKSHLHLYRGFHFIATLFIWQISSTPGHEKYSAFIQDCFRDLHPAVMESRAEIYPYVGDEAVLTWPSDISFEDNNCLKAFFEFESELANKRAYYQGHYGVVPVFKGGLNTGRVMVAEVGVVKRDIAYHSDVLNTAARIQALCNEKNARLLVSDQVIKNLKNHNGYEILERGAVEVRGKNEKVLIYEIRES